MTPAVPESSTWPDDDSSIVSGLPSSRASSPLSSATPSPGPTNSGLPNHASNNGSRARSEGSRRDDRSQTSSTAPLSNLSDEESDLTEAEGEEEEAAPIERSRSTPRRKQEQESHSIREHSAVSEDLPIGDTKMGSDDDGMLSVVESENGSVKEERGELGENDPEADAHMNDLEEVQDIDMDDQSTEKPPRSHRDTPTRSHRSSPSLTPPPPSELSRSKNLPPSEGASHEEGSEDGEQRNDEDEEGNIDEEGGDEDERDGRNNEADGQVEADDMDQSEERMEEEDQPAETVSIKQSQANGIGEAEEGEDGTTEVYPGLSIHIDGPEETSDENVDGEAEVAETTAQPTKTHHSSHAPPPSQAHIRELFRLELKFAALRDQLYVERMEEVAAEEEMILNGTHPALQYLYRAISDRRERLHEVASRRHKEAREELKRAKESDSNHTWTWWTEQRDTLQWEEFEATWSKRRRLAREKNEIETPRIVKPVPRAGGRVHHFDWSAGAAPSRMSMDDASADLAMMENRPIVPTHLAPMSRHVSPIVYNAPASRPAQINTQPGLSHTNGIQRQPAQPQQPQQTYAYNQNSLYGIPRPAQPPQPPPAASSSSARPPAPRPQGRTVPTTSDFFESGRKDPPAMPMGWQKPEIRPINGHMAKDALGLTTSPAAPASVKTEDRPMSRFPGLAEYMNNTNQRASPTSNTANVGGYNNAMGLGAKILSPPTSSSTGILGGFGRPPGVFSTTQNVNPTAAGTTMNRP